MKFSIIIPAYNSENYIENGLKSIRNQDYEDYELIVVCDSCIDKTEEIAANYGAISYSVNYHNDGFTRNVGIDIAQGDWILFMDDDDWWLHEFVLTQLSQKLDTVDTDILTFSFIWKGIGYTTPLSPSNDYYPAVWNKCWKRSFIGNTRFPNVYSISDYYFHNDMMKKKPKIEVWDMPLYYYNYLREGSISHQMGRTLPSTKQYWENH